MAESTRKKNQTISLETRIRVYEDYTLGHTQKKIAKRFQITQQSVSNIIKRYKETGSYNDRPRSGRKKTARTRKNITKVKRIIARNSVKSTRKIAKQLKISNFTVHKILKDDLGLHPYKMVKKPLLSAATIKKRLHRCLAFQERFDDECLNIVFSDEKLFTIEPSTYKIRGHGNLKGDLA